MFGFQEVFKSHDHQIPNYSTINLTISPRHCKAVVVRKYSTHRPLEFKTLNEVFATLFLASTAKEYQGPVPDVPGSITHVRR